MQNAFTFLAAFALSYVIGTITENGPQNSVKVPVEITLVDNSEACESSVLDCQQTNEPSTKLPDTTDIAGSSVQKLIPPTHEELLQFERNHWDLVLKPSHVNIIVTKWIFKNKTDEQGRVIRNKARLVAQRYSQIKDGREECFLNGYLSEEVYVAQPK
ncbi:Retrovirus-related Pol polyprotein from transposon TNT 1-94 [Cucumis melo var. makuwa]|nr:Retrovirus-related Pol polyprotein from transposon TNT 1-94 [Cucumis melo var. makuwa]